MARTFVLDFGLWPSSSQKPTSTGCSRLRDAIEAVEDSFLRLAAGTIENVPRYRVRLEDGGFLAVMSAVDRERGARVREDVRRGTGRRRRSSSCSSRGAS